MIIKIFYIYLLLSPILDALSNSTIGKVSMVVRGLFTCLMFIYLLRNKKYKETIAVSIITVIYSVYSYFYLKYGLMDSLSCVLKLIFLMLSLLTIPSIDKDNKFDKVLFIILSTYIGIYLISYIFGFGNNIYLEHENKVGFRGLFNSINEFSAIILMLYYLTYKYISKNKLLLIFITMLIFVISYLSGTKVLLFGLVIVLIIKNISGLYIKFKNLNLKNKIIYSICFLCLIGICGYLFTFTSTYYNMTVQANFFRVDNIFSLDFINRVVFNNRLTFLGDNYNYFMSTDIISKIFGIGYFNSFKLIEIDLFDILFRYGIISLIFIIGTFVYAIRNNKINKNMIYGLIILFLISLTSGHVLLNPNVCIYFSIMILHE